MTSAEPAGVRLGDLRMRHPGGIHWGFLTPDRSRVACGGWSGEVRVFERETGKMVASLDLGSGLNWDVRPLRDGAGFLVAGGREVREFDTATFEELRQWFPHDAIVGPLRVLADEQRFLSGGRDGSVGLTVMDTGERTGAWQTFSDRVMHASCTANGAVLAAMDTRRVRVWRSTDGVVLLDERLDGEPERGAGLLLLPDVSALVVYVRSRWQVTRWRLTGAPQRKDLVIDGDPNSIAHVPGTRNVLLQTGADMLELDAMELEEVARWSGPGTWHRPLCWSMEGDLLVTSHDHGFLGFWDRETRRRLDDPHGHVGSVAAVALSADGRRAATAGADGALGLWESRTGRVERWVPDLCQVRPEKMHFEDDGRLCIDTGGDWVAVGMQGDPEEIEAPPGALADAEMPTGFRVAHTSHQGRISVREEGETVLELVHPCGYVLATGFLPHGRLLISAGTDRQVRFWNLTTGKEFLALEEPEDLATVRREQAMAVSPRGDAFALAGLDGSVLIYSLVEVEPRSPGERVHVDSRKRFRAHAQPVEALAFSGDGEWLITGSEDGTARIWGVGELLTY